mmetsp:Transcript_16072/g.44236  ORF Transcript_16072/g.44236 Transcript_16072/m.44236 type:complete len:493 (+) Transcript_16072:215-1693(+)
MMKSYYSPPTLPLLGLLLLLVVVVVDARRIGRKKKNNDFPLPSGQNCFNTNELCEFWAENGECQVNPNYMKTECCAACAKFAEPATAPVLTEAYSVYYSAASSSRQKSLADDESQLAALTALSEQYGVPQTARGEARLQVGRRLRASLDYLQRHETLLQATMTGSSSKKCINDNALCTTWQVEGQCEARPEFMHAHCAVACQTCHGDAAVRLPESCGGSTSTSTTQPLWSDGAALQSMFETLVAQEGVQVHSRPDAVWYAQYGEGAVRDKTLDPWLVSVDRIISNDDCQALMAAAAQNVQVEVATDGSTTTTSSSGTSSSGQLATFRGLTDEAGGPSMDYQATWLPQSAASSLVQAVSQALNLSADYATDVKITKYGPGQYHNIHHDYEPHVWDAQPAAGARVLTVQVDLTGVGSGTTFNNLRTTVPAQAGRALVFPNVLASHPQEADLRLQHQDERVNDDGSEDDKWVATMWFHLYKYQDAKAAGCVVEGL